MKSIRRWKRYDKFMNEQMRILHGHIGRCVLNCMNEFMRLEIEEFNVSKKVKGCGAYETRGKYTFTCGSMSARGNVELCQKCRAALKGKANNGVKNG